MYIEPNSTIRIMRDCPLDNSYTDTIFFTSETAQRKYFNSLVGRTFPRQSYQRVEKGVMRLEVVADAIYDYNYMMFQNTAYGNKWFYAFITAVEWVNNVTSEIHFEIDVMQTWLFDVSLGASIVEREHVSVDTVGAHIQPEPVDIGPIKCNNIRKGGLSNNYSIVVFVADAGPPIPVPFDTFHGWIGGLYSGCNGIYAPLSDEGAQTVTDFINRLTSLNKDGTIVNIVICPTSFIPTVKTEARAQSFVVPKPTTCGGYTPRNKKLLTAPYCFLTVDTLNDAQNYRYEWSNNENNILFHMVVSFTSDPTANIYPVDYNGAWTSVGGAVAMNPTESVTISGFPQCPYAIDGFKAWLAQKAAPMAANILGAGLGGVFDYTAALSRYGPRSKRGLNIGNAIAESSAMGVAGTVANGIIEATKGSRIHGGNTADADIASRQKDVYFKYMSVTEEYAEIIDDFFDRYGYACNELKIPNRNARERWTYCKTRECNLTGGAPASDLDKMKEIYNNGITWWVNGSEVGHYELSNKPNG